MEQPIERSETSELPNIDQTKSDQFLKVKIGQLQRTPPVSEPVEDHPKENFETYDEFLTRVKTWVDAAKEETQDASQFNILSNTEFTKMVEQDKGNCERNRPQRDHSRVAKRIWQKRRREMRKRREQQIKQLHSIRSQYNISQQTISNPTTDPKPTTSGTGQCSSFSSAGPSTSTQMFNLPQFTQYRANKRKLCTESAVLQSKKAKLLNTNNSSEAHPSAKPGSETTLSQSSEYDDESSLENVSSMDDSGLSLLNDSELSLIDDLDMNLSYVWVNCNVPSPKVEDVQNSSTSSDES